MPSFEISIPVPLARLLARKRVPAVDLMRLMEQKPADEAARVVFALRLVEPHMSVESLVALAAQAMRTEIGVVDRSDAIPRSGLRVLYLLLESLDREEVEIAFRRSSRDVASSVIDSEGKASGRTYMEFGDLK